MCIVRVRRRRTLAFTLLEVTLAVAILGMMALAIYRFVSTNLTAVRVSTELSAEEARYEGLATCGKAAGEGCIVGTLDVESQEQ